MNPDTSIILRPEKVVDNEWFNATFVRQPDGRLLAHINYYKWSPTAKKVTKELMDSFDEPLYIFIHDRKHFKFVTSLGFEPSGRLVTCLYEGKEDNIYPEAVYIKEGVEQYILKSYEEESKSILPFECLDGYGKIEKLEEFILGCKQVEWTTKHYFSDGVYTRETFIPKGTVLTGYRHKQKTVSVLVSGIISVIAVDKQGYATSYGVLKPPMTFITKPGMKKVGYAHEDTVFINSFSLSGVPEDKQNEENIDYIENIIFDKEEVKCLE